MPETNSHSTWALVSQGGYLWQSANCGRRHATFLQREIQTVPGRSEDGDTRLGDRKLLRALAGATAPAAGVVKGRRSVPIGEGWRLAGVGRDRPITLARACVAASLRCGSDRRLRVGMPALAVHACVYVGAEAVVGTRVKTRVRGGASSSTRWGEHRRCCVAPACRGFANSATKRKP